ncbi:hypothetical protein WJX84_001072 [Apatococcus fuscideae]|uniref:Uncharacterized protein n=1 Tax=Apatococcus fuscideae TaxID=2026836 RepID=A0AAW1T941_9CHLO
MTHSDGPPTAMVQGSWTEKAHAAIEIIESMERTFTGTNPATSGPEGYAAASAAIDIAAGNDNIPTTLAEALAVIKMRSTLFT